MQQKPKQQEEEKKQVVNGDAIPVYYAAIKLEKEIFVQH